ncbi:MAG: methionyl-tRNA formyltransferase [Candidatus Omnitrophota bacterium]
MKIVFFGTDDLAKENLRALIDSKHKVVGCVTQPDRPKGRNLQLASAETKNLALKNNIDVFQPLDLKDSHFLEQLRSLQADLFVVIAYGRILTDAILSLPKIFSVNVHTSLLPKYRGAAPIQWAILNGEEQTGISIIKINPRLDEGDVIAQKIILIDEEDNAISLKEKMKNESPRFLLETLEKIESNEFCLFKQDQAKATLAPKLTKEMGRIDWMLEAYTIHNYVRGLVPWPNAYTYFGDKILKILETKVVALEHLEGVPGEVLAILKDGFIVRAGHGALLIKKVHLESSRLMDAKSFISGYKMKIGFRFR